MLEEVKLEEVQSTALLKGLETLASRVGLIEQETTLMIKF
jgi:hypothetical protein